MHFVRAVAPDLLYTPHGHGDSHGGGGVERRSSPEAAGPPFVASEKWFMVNSEFPGDCTLIRDTL